MSCSQDIRLEAEGAVYYFKFLRWDTDFFGRDCYILDTERSVLKFSWKIKDSIDKDLKGSFITAKVTTSLERGLFDFLQTAGFRYIETEIALKYETGFRNREAAASDVEILKLEKNEDLPYEELGSVFNLTRFHRDVNIAKEKADLLWINYIKNYKPSPTAHMFVARDRGKTAGSILVNQSEDRKRANLFFVSVIERFRGKNIGSRLIQYVVDQFDGVELTTGTQASNTGALNFYIKNGFSIIEKTNAVFHRWG